MNVAGKPFSSGCFVCGKPTNDGGSRGLCQVHYRRFNKKLKSFATVELAEIFEAKCLAEGWVTPRQVGGRPKEVDPFDVIAEEVLSYNDETKLVPKDVADFVKKHGKPDSAVKKKKRTS